jgi:hypothetical protein
MIAGPSELAMGLPSRSLLSSILVELRVVLSLGGIGHDAEHLPPPAVLFLPPV